MFDCLSLTIYSQHFQCTISTFQSVNDLRTLCYYHSRTSVTKVSVPPKPYALVALLTDAAAMFATLSLSGIDAWKQLLGSSVICNATW